MNDVKHYETDLVLILDGCRNVNNQVFNISTNAQAEMIKKWSFIVDFHRFNFGTYLLFSFKRRGLNNYIIQSLSLPIVFLRIAFQLFSSLTAERIEILNMSSRHFQAMLFFWMSMHAQTERAFINNVDTQRGNICLLYWWMLSYWVISKFNYFHHSKLICSSLKVRW